MILSEIIEAQKITHGCTLRNTKIFKQHSSLLFLCLRRSVGQRRGRCRRDDNICLDKDESDGARILSNRRILRFLMAVNSRISTGF